jgi:predicted O-methyltransferase YrrM
MDYFSKVKAEFDDLPYMGHPQATLLRDLIVENDAENILEVGFYHGKSSAYLAAVLEDLGRGHLVTMDLHNARQREPNIEQILSALDLTHRVTPVYADRSYTWEMARMIRARPRPQFDLCFFDGGHTWDVTGFGFVLVDMLLRPGGWIVFDDLLWTIEAAEHVQPRVPKVWRTFSPDERTAPAVKLVFDLLVPHLGYTNKRILNDGQWGIARKPIHHASAQGRFRQLVQALSRW